ncbi:MAG: hypothetical protein OSA93_12015 [Akkermansiaceae bacterium]|nr:hypothetical protein [Akkermansiaceae bacterium]
MKNEASYGKGNADHFPIIAKEISERRKFLADQDVIYLFGEVGGFFCESEAG